MTTSKIKFTERWKDHLEYYKHTAKRIDGKTIQYTFHMFVGERRMRLCSTSTNGFEKVKEMIDHSLLKRLTHSEFFSWKWLTKFWYLHKDWMEVMRNFCEVLKSMQLVLESTSLSTFWTWVQVQKRLKFEEYTDNLGGNGTNLLDISRMYILFKNIQSWKDAEVSKTKTCTSTQELHFRRRQWSSQVQAMTSECFTEFEIILDM